MRKNPLTQLNKELQKCDSQIQSHKNKITELESKKETILQDIEQQELSNLNALLKSQNLTPKEVLQLIKSKDI